MGQLNVKLSEDVTVRLKVYAIREDKPIYEIVEEILDKNLPYYE